jgi:hypothetical protein
MKGRDTLTAAVARLGTALDQLEAASGRRAAANAARGDIEEEFAILEDDRSRLAVELDGAIAREKALGGATRETHDRIRKATEIIETLVADLASEDSGDRREGTG